MLIHFKLRGAMGYVRSNIWSTWQCSRFPSKVGFGIGMQFGCRNRLLWPSLGCSPEPLLQNLTSTWGRRRVVDPTGPYMRFLLVRGPLRFQQRMDQGFQSGVSIRVLANINILEPFWPSLQDGLYNSLGMTEVSGGCGLVCQRRECQVSGVLYQGLPEGCDQGLA